jgi:hypothetical protein
MSWHEKLDRLAGEFLEETDAILGAEERLEARRRYSREIKCIARLLNDQIASIHEALLRDAQ